MRMINKLSTGFIILKEKSPVQIRLCRIILPRKTACREYKTLNPAVIIPRNFT